MKKVGYILFVITVVMTFLNFSSIFTEDRDLNLKFVSIEALAQEEDLGGSDDGGYELRIGMCEDGVEDFTSCEWDPELTGRNCEMSDERDCSPGNNPSNLGQMGNNESCVQNGHMFYESSCFRYCLRCNYTKYICD